MNWPFVRRSKYIKEKTLRISNKEEAELCKSKLTAKINMLDEFRTANIMMGDELTEIKRGVEILRVGIDALQITNADLNIENTKLKEVNTNLLFAKKDLKQKIRKLESENSKLKTTNKQLQAIHKTLGFFIRKAYEQLNK